MDRPFTIRDLGEVAIRCCDLAAMTAFYRDLLGLEVIDGDYPETAVRLCIGTGHGGEARHLTLFVDDDGDGGEAEDDPPCHHLVLTVSVADLPVAAAWFRARGLAVEQAERPSLGWKSLYLRNPEGNTVELVAATRQHTPEAGAD